MLQNARFGTGLDKYQQYISIFDNTVTSDNYFRLFDIPDKLYVGKNSFRIRTNLDNLVRGSLIYIDIIDSAGNTIYHEVADFVGEDKARLIVAYIYENTTPGEATIYIAGRASVDVRTGQQIPYTKKAGGYDWIDIPNVLWSKKVVVVPNKQNNDEVLFVKAPKVSSIERFEFFNNYSGSINRKVVDSGSFTLKMVSAKDDYEYSNTSRYATKYREDGVNTILDPKTEDGKIVSNQDLLPLYSDFSTIVATAGTFNKDMVGGEIVIRDIDGLTGGSGFQDYSCSIIEVIDATRARVSPNFQRISNNDTVYKSFTAATNVTMSYYSSTPQLVTIDSESFVQLDFEGLEPLAGSVESVKISYKPYGSFGEFINVGDFQIKEQNYLVDTTDLVTTKTDLKERAIGEFSSSAEFDTYWDIIPGHHSASHFDTSVLETGRQFTSSIASGAEIDSYLYQIKLKDAYSIPAVAGTEYKLSLSVHFEEPGTATPRNQIDVHISGSGVTRNIINDWDAKPPLKDYGLGTAIGTITATGEGQTNKYDFFFRIETTNDIIPILVIRSSKKFSLKNITLSPRNELGYSPNQAKLFIPIETLKTNTELVMNIDYLSGTGLKSNISSQLYGLVFSGRNFLTQKLPDGILSSSEQIADDISGSFDSISGSIATDIVEVSGSVVTVKTDLNELSGSFETLKAKTLISGSAQIADDISGSWDQLTLEVESAIDTLESDVIALSESVSNSQVDNESRLGTLETYNNLGTSLVISSGSDNVWQSQFNGQKIWFDCRDGDGGNLTFWISTGTPTDGDNIQVGMLDDAFGIYSGSITSSAEAGKFYSHEQINGVDRLILSNSRYETVDLIYKEKPGGWVVTNWWK